VACKNVILFFKNILFLGFKFLSKLLSSPPIKEEVRTVLFEVTASLPSFFLWATGLILLPRRKRRVRLYPSPFQRDSTINGGKVCYDK